MSNTVLNLKVSYTDATLTRPTTLPRPEGTAMMEDFKSVLPAHGLAREPGCATPFVELYEQPQQQWDRNGHKHGKQQDANGN